jgi:hypothetical protein
MVTDCQCCARRSRAKGREHNTAGSADAATHRDEPSVPVRWAIGEQALVVVAGALAPTGVSVVLGARGQDRIVVQPRFVLGELNQSVAIVHEPSPYSGRECVPLCGVQ